MAAPAGTQTAGSGRANNKPKAILEGSEKLDLFKRFISSPTFPSFGDGINVTCESLA